jgi:Zn-dependent peptidase ImmA (M78 family)
MMNHLIYEKVQSLVKKYKTRDPEELIDCMNIKLVSIKDSKHLLGMYHVILRNRFIFIADDVGRQRKLILAHELGHDQLHRDLVSNGIAFHENGLFVDNSRNELQANIFAAHLLIPDEDIINLLCEGVDDRSLSEELGVDINLVNLKISEMVKLGLLNSKDCCVERPKSNFLKDYELDPKDWSGC